VELATVNVVGRYARGEHDVCIALVLNMGRLNRVFEQVDVPYGPRLEPGSEASKEAAKKRKDDADAKPTGKCTKVSSRKVMALKAPAVPRGLSIALSKMALVKATPTPHAKFAPKASALLRASVSSKAGAPSKVGAPTKAVVLKSTATVATLKDGVLRISIGMKRSSADSLQASKGKHARIDVLPPLAYAPTRKAMTRSQPPTESEDGRVAYCHMLDSVLSVESYSSSSSSDSFESESIMASPPPIPNMLISMELHDIAETPEVEAARQTMSVEAEARAVSRVGELSCFCMFCSVVVNDVDLGVGCAGTHDGGDADAGLCQVVQGQSSIGVMDGDDEQIIQCLKHVGPRDLSFTFFLWCLSFK
jgi:hypothetical protein